MLKLLSIIIVTWLLAGLLLYLKQRDLLYFPTAQAERSDSDSFWLDSDGARLKVWHLNPGGRQAVIYFGGNAEAVEWNIDRFRRLLAPHSVYLANYRGYGGSSGQPSEQALITDALALYDRIAPEHSAVHVMGRSLGSGVAVQLAAQRRVAKLVLITPYDSIENVAAGHYPMFPVRWLIRDRFDSLEFAGSINSRTLVLVAAQDRVIPPRHAHNLVRHLIRAPTESHDIPGTHHNNIMDSAQSLHLVRTFLRER